MQQAQREAKTFQTHDTESLATQCASFTGREELLACVMQGRAMANDLLVACPMQLTTTVKSLSIESHEPVSQQESTGTNFISWLYTDVTNTTSANCTRGTRNELTEGEACSGCKSGF